MAREPRILRIEAELVVALGELDPVRAEHARDGVEARRDFCTDRREQPVARIERERDEVDVVGGECEVGVVADEAPETTRPSPPASRSARSGASGSASSGSTRSGSSGSMATRWKPVSSPLSSIEGP